MVALLITRAAKLHRVSWYSSVCWFRLEIYVMHYSIMDASRP
jgi:hypothetical protein